VPVGRADLHVTSAVLDEMRAALISVTGTLDQARRLLAATDPAVAGAPPLVSQAEQYAASWRYGITQLGQHTHGCVQDLTGIAAAFTQADQQLAGVVRGTGPPEPGPGR
jgi:hypothetical protein